MKLDRLRVRDGLLKLIISWLQNIRACVSFGKDESKIFYTQVGLLQDSSLSPYRFVLYHSDIIASLGAIAGKSRPVLLNPLSQTFFDHRQIPIRK